MADPYELKRAGFSITKIYQKPGDIVITFPKAYHWGFNAGNNINEAFNFGTKNWFSPFTGFKNCKCKFVPKLNFRSLTKNMESNISNILELKDK